MSSKVSTPCRRSGVASHHSRSGLTAAPVLLVLLAALPVLAGLGWMGWGRLAGDAGNPSSESVQRVPIRDTVLVYGPRVFKVAHGQTALHVEEFRIPARPGARYRVVVTNGADDGSARAERTSLNLNDTQLLSEAERLGERQTVLEDVPLHALNQLVLDVSGAEGSYVTVSVYEVGTPSTTIFGPVELIRTTGAPDENSWSFQVPAGIVAPFTLFINNGFADGSSRATAAWVDLNGVEVFGTDDFGQAVGTLSADVTPQDSTNVLHLTIAGQKGSRIEAYLTGVDTTAPVIAVTSPEQGLITSEDSVLVLGKAVDVTDVTVTVNGLPAQVTDDSLFSVEVPLSSEGLNVITATATDAAGNSSVATTTVTRDTTTPVLNIVAPADGLITKTTPTPFVGSVDDVNGATVTVNGTPVATDTTGAFADSLALAEGPNVFTITATDPAGNQTVEVRTVTLDDVPPVLTVDHPADSLITDSTSITVSGTVTDETPVTVDANGVPLPVDGAGVFTGQVSLSEGANIITVTATDAAGNTATVVRIVTSDTEAPVLTVDEPTDGAVTTSETITVSGQVQDLTAVTLTVNGVSFTVAQDGSFTGTTPVAEGPNTITVVATDAVGHTTTVSRSVTRSTGGQLPPDPATVAPPLNMSVTTTTFAATQFLYTGSNPIQTGVDSGTINPAHAAVMRGRVLGRDGAPISGVSVSILDHPELGQTLTRTDGRFDLAVNGGGDLTVDYEKSGLLPVQRTIDVPWQDFVAVDDVVMIAIDPQVTAIDFSQPIEVAQGSIQSDADGTRQATLLFRQGTTAEMVMPDSSLQPLGTLHVRATEYTVGPNGPASMPAELPPTSAYTYAVDLSADEATSVGALGVRFSQPVAVYVQNFLNLPVGLRMPIGVYDPHAAHWKSAEDGRVIEIVSTDGGVATVDISGDGVADGADSLAALDITDSELAQLASIYSPGETVWRFETDHFSAMDENLPASLPEGSKTPTPDKMSGGSGTGGDKNKSGDVDDPCKDTGSIIECQNQVLGERIAVTGTPFSLNYRSSRVPGRASDNTLVIPLIGDSVPDGLQEIDLRVDVAGRTFRSTFPATPDQQTTFAWDGLDAYGRRVQGAQPVSVTIGYFYAAKYASPAGGTESFGAVGGDSLSVPARVGQTLSLTQRATLGTWDARGEGLGGWTLSVHHHYDPIGHVLYRGDGGRRSANSLGRTIRTVAGTGGYAYSGDGGPAIDATFETPAAVAVGADGSLYIADTFNNVIRRVTPDGIITTFAGTGVESSTGDGGPATAATLHLPVDVAMGPDQSLYIVESQGHRIRRVDPDGIITTVAGTGVSGFSGDGGPATAAQLANPYGVAAGADGSVYIADALNNRVRRVSPSGTITTLAGTGAGTFGGDGGEAVQAQLYIPTGVAVGVNGEVYIADAYNRRVRVVRTDGRIFTVAGGGTVPSGVDPSGYGDGGPATAAYVFTPFHIALGADGSLYVSEVDGARIRRVGPDGLISTLAGTGDFTFSGDGGPPALASMEPDGVAVGPDGTVYVGDDGGDRVRAIAPTLPGFDNAPILIASNDGSEFYGFDLTGKHLDTRDALTGATLFQFQYDSTGALSGILDAFGNQTTIERDGSGVPSAIVGPFGQRTALSVADSAGYLTAVEDPANEATTFSYHSGGLLATLTDPRNSLHTFAFDSLGRLTEDNDPAGGSITITRQVAGDTVTVGEATALGRATTYNVITQVDGGQIRKATDPAGLVTESAFGADGTATTTTPDGTVTRVVRGPDPRGGMQAPIATQTTVSTPSGLTSTMRSSRSATLTDASDPFSLAVQLDSLFVNGRPFVQLFMSTDSTVVSTTPEGRRSTMQLGTRGELLEESLPGVLSVDYSYDPEGRLTGLTQGGRNWQYEYDGDGRVATATDALSRATRFYYDQVDRLTREVLPDSSEVSYVYDGAGNLVSMTPPGRSAHTFRYDSINETTAYVPPSVDAGDPATYYSYNADHALTRVLRPDGAGLDLGYDGAGRVSSVTFPGGTLEYGYDPISGRLIGVNGPYSGALSLSYDGTLLTGMQWIGEVSGTVDATYDNDFRVSALQVNGATPVSFAYDGDGLLTGAGALVATRDTASGRLVGTSLGGVMSDQSYNEFGELAGLRWSYGGVSLLATSYTRDGLGRVETKREIVGSDTTTWNYGYDAASRLKQVDENGVTVAAYGYDTNGNRTSLTNSGGLVTATYDAQDRLLTYGTTTYTYTANGELTQRVQGPDTTRYAYDVLGNLLEVKLPDGTDVQYLVDGLGQRIGRKVNGTLTKGWLYQDRLHPIAELDGNGNLLERYVYGTRTDVPDYMIKGGATYRIVADELGSVRLVVDVATGAVAQSLSYDSWGRVLLDTNPGFQPFGYAGGLYDETTGLVRFGARDYAADVGRWLTKDPAGFGSGSLNQYTYAKDNPTTYRDPTGLCKIDLVFKDIFWGLAQHAYVLTTDLDGSQTVFRGGPSGTLWDLDLGQIQAVSQDWRSSKDWPKVVDEHHRHRFVPVLDDECPCEGYDRRFAEAVDEINSLHVPYKAFGPNSNTAAAVILILGGFVPPAPPPGTRAPGYFRP